MKKLGWLTITALSMLMALSLKSVVFALADTVTVPYVDAAGNSQPPVACQPVSKSMSTGWYTVMSNVSFDNRIEISGEVNLILQDNITLTANAGIHIPDGSKLTIWAQSSSSQKGRIKAVTDHYFNAAIGGDRIQTTGEFIINGGDITATGSPYSYAALRDGNPGIGCRKITINGGEVDANGRGSGSGNNKGAGIGGEVITINGGIVTAKGSPSSPGIGSGWDDSFTGSLTINGGTVTATAESGAGIGGGWGKGFSGTITINGGVVTAESVGGAGIGGGWAGEFSGTLTITGGNVTAISERYCAGIGSGRKNNLTGTIDIKGNAQVTARGGSYGSGGAGIGAGGGGNAADAHIYIGGNAYVKAVGGTGAAGIGGGNEDSKVGGEGCDNVQINGGTVIAQSGEGSCSAIGHGDNDAHFGRITFKSGMMVKAGDDEDHIERIFTASEREDACQYRHYACIQECEHPWVPVEDSELLTIPFVSITAETHLRGPCVYCGQVFSAESHDLDAARMCEICGYQANGSRVTFDPNGGSEGMEDIFIAVGKALVLPECLFTAPQGYRFIGWKIGEKTYQAGEAVTVNGDLTAVAQWGMPFTITLDPGEGDGKQATVEAYQGDKYPLPSCEKINFTEPEWYRFKGWAINDDVTELKQALEIVEIKGNTTVTAIWERPIRHVVFNLGGGEGDVNEQDVANGEHASKPTTEPTLKDCTFKGWYLDDEVFDFEEIPVTRDIILTAGWLTPWAALQQNIDEAENGSTITLPDDVTAKADDVALEIPTDKAITLDLAGHTLSRGLNDAEENGNVITVNGSLTIEDSGTGGKITGGWNQLIGGGGIRMKGDSLVLNGGSITGNKTTGDGGGVHIEAGTFTMNGGSITYNEASGDGGGVCGKDDFVSFTMIDGSISNNTADYCGGGVGAFYGTFTMAGGTICNNKSNERTGKGGGVYSNTAFTMKSGANVSENVAGYGGGVYICGGSFAMESGGITQNKSIEGGGLYIFSGPNYPIESVIIASTISGNKADGDGGGVYSEDDFTVNGGSITGNTAGDSGGGVFVEDGLLTLADAGSSISNNTAEGNGGGVYLSKDCAIVMNNGSINSNQAHYGGGIYADISADSVTITGGGVNGNQADKDNGQGGGVYSYAERFDFSGGSISNNGARYGGGVYAMECEFTMTGGSINGNTATNAGGGVAIELETFSMTGGNIKGNNADDGGGVAVRYRGSFSIADGIDTSGHITGNDAKELGGGIWVSDSAENVKLSGIADITDNTANDKSSGIYLENGKAITVEDNLTNRKPIGIAMQTPGVFTIGLKGDRDSVKFKSDEAGLAVGINESGEAFLAEANFTVTFNSNGGSSVSDQGVLSGYKVNKPDDPKREGHILAAWYLDDKEYDFDTPVESDLALNARWIRQNRYLNLEPGQCVTLAGEGIRIASDNEAAVKVDGMKLTAAEGEEGTATLTVYDGNGKEIERYSVTVSPISTGVFSMPDELTEIKANAFAELPNAKKVILGENVKTLDRDAFAGTTLSQLVVNSMTLTLPEGFAFNKEAGLTILCMEDSEIAKQLTGEAFEDVNISVVYPAE